ncbi:hypothetical protein EAI_13623 [Harpegnathos saltator]|uniref:Uncharacterized protein n=1 Tax=Harpegnathos saltator TaxID=610380 RepID=E2BDU5_HARSA|nr:hypothetical protein EAI_13623 [Harpegnathos saltator]
MFLRENRRNLDSMGESVKEQGCHLDRTIGRICGLTVNTIVLELTRAQWTPGTMTTHLRGHSKKLAGGFLTPVARTLTDSWKLWEQVALVSWHEANQTEPNRSDEPTVPSPSRLSPRVLGREGSARSGHSFRIASDKGVTGC